MKWRPRFFRCLLATGILASTICSSSTTASASSSATTCTSNSKSRLVAEEDGTMTSNPLNPSTQDSNNNSFSMRHPVLERILAREQESDVIDRSIELLKQRGAHRCWHKHSVFLDHLVGVADIIRLWNQQDEILRLVALFHSAYSNSYVNLALLDPATERKVLSNVIGEQAEAIVFLFCSIDRQEIVVNSLLKQGFIPKEGITVRNIRGGEDVYLSPEMLFRLLVFTMADIADQYFGWQDDLFGGGGNSGSMLIPGEDHPNRHDPTALWPGLSRPGLWMSYVSQLATVARSYSSDFSAMPPVFSAGTQVLSVENDAKARDLYWSVVTLQVSEDQVDATLEACVQTNPWAFEPYVLLAQKRLHAGDFGGAVHAATQALDLQHQWGTAWDKRLSFGAWVAWTRVLLQRAQAQESWPTNSWQVNNFGLVH